MNTENGSLVFYIIRRYYRHNFFFFSETFVYIYPLLLHWLDVIQCQFLSGVKLTLIHELSY